ncbi:MAG: amino acid adenylation domain-containing protein [Desulfobacterales bacterium]|nr:amino acid adenylation domain-containing protein [Desulfobacterales bacterium]
MGKKQEIIKFLKVFLEKALPELPGDDYLEIPFLEMGANSLVLMQVQQAIENKYKLKIEIPMFFEQLTNMRALVDYIADNSADSASPALPDNVAAKPSMPISTPIPTVTPAPISASTPITAPVSIPTGTFDSSMLNVIFNQQMQAASQTISNLVARQLQFLGELNLSDLKSTDLEKVSAKVPEKIIEKSAEKSPQKPIEKPPEKATSSAVMHKLLSPLEIRARGLTERQRAHLEALISRYTKRTRKSKELTAKYRGVLADSRAAVGFRFTTKEMLYPIVGKYGKGARVWDIDDNEYVDITMGQGVILFGHEPDFILEALNNSKACRILGPRPFEVLEASELICEFTGMERVTYTNSGTEAVMAALRIARAVTLRNKIVMFENAYHGHADNVMGRAVWQDNILNTVPVAPGINQHAVDDLWILEYDTPSALDYIRNHAKEIAAVIVESVQSRRPDLQPREFLHELRKITSDNGIVFIVDEMITGFRVHPGGAQAIFGIKADIATYGKVLGGGMPIGVVAGMAKYMDAIDGGAWQYNDASYPKVNRTIFGGTFCQHPTAMVATLASLRYLKAQGPALQLELNRKTKEMAENLNRFFEAEEIPIKVVYFGSLFRFAFSANFELLFYHMMEKGVFIWEWRNYFLCSAHTDADIAHIIKAVKESVIEMRQGGFLPESSKTKSVSAASASSCSSFTHFIPLTKAQRQLAVLDQIAPEGSKAYHVSPLLSLKGKVDISALEAALLKVIERHASLRSVIDGDYQKVLSLNDLPGNGKLNSVDLTQLQADSKSNISEWLADYARQRFDLKRGPLFEVNLLKIAEEDWCLVFKGHHIVIDGLSMNIIMRELAAFYNGQNVNTPQSWQEYVEWRNHTTFPKQEEYWLNQLQGELPVTMLPTDYIEPAIKTYRGGRYAIKIDSQISDALAAIGRTQGCTDFMVLFASYALWLHRLTGQTDLIIGMPVAGRSTAASSANNDSLVGYCTHLIPIRSKINWDQPFTEYIKSMRSVLLYGYQHQDYPFAELIEKLNLRRDGQRSPIVSVLFNLDRPGSAPAMNNLTIDWLSQPIYFTAFDLTVNLTQVETKLILECDFNLDLFEASTIERYVNNYITLLQGIVKDPKSTVARLPLLTEKEKQQILFDWNATTVDYPKDKCMHHLFEEQAAKYPEAIALRSGSRQISYRELNHIANRIAHGLLAHGTRPEDVIGIYMHHSIELVASLLGILKAGAAYLPLDPTYPPKRLAFMLSDAHVKILLTHTPLQTSLPEIDGIKVISIDCSSDNYVQHIFAEHPEDNPVVPVTPQHLAYVIYTSGSTGLPKGTMIVHQGLVNYLVWAVKYYRVAEGDGSVLHSSIGFDATITSLFTPLIAGRCLWLFASDNQNLGHGQELENIHAALMSGQNWSLLKFTPAHLELINAMIPEQKLAGSTRCLVFGGEALLGRQVAPWRKHAPETRLINEYGPTETVVGCCIYEVEERDPNPGSLPIGKPIDNTRLYILDTNYEPVPVGVTGELYIGGDGVARGYLGREQLTAERFISVNALPGERLYRTGDVVKYRPDGIILYLGRIDNQVKIRGYRVELGEVENALIRQSGVREAVVIAHRRSDQDIRLIAWVVSDKLEKLEELKLRQALSLQLPAHMVPSNIIIVDSLPLTVNGKVDRAALPMPEYLRSEISRTAIVNPRTEAEERIAAIWRDLLGIKQVGMNDNFFEIGGHSLLILPLIERLKSAFGRSLSPVDIFRYHTVATQAAQLSDSQDTLSKTPLQKLRTTQDSLNHEPIAIVGMALRVPNAANLDQFWQNLRNGVESITFWSTEQLRSVGVSQELIDNPEYIKSGFILADADQFDADFFEMTPREAQILDPQHRMLMECSVEALEHAGYDPKRYHGRIGMFGGVGLNTYLIHNILGHPELIETMGGFYVTLHNDKDFAPTRVAYKLDLRGPAISINTACSSSLVAVALGCQSLLNRQTDIILAGGCTINLPQDTGYLYHKGGILSKDGRCRPFDIKANGTVDGSGVAVVVLKRLSDAIQDGDTVHAVISGYAVNNDGSLKVGFTAPSIEGQANVILDAQTMAKISADDISFIETHGTGTDLGDAVEVAALTQAFKQNSKAEKHGYCTIGSVKANVGHLDTAAGVASLIKTVLSLNHEMIPMMPTFSQPNPKLELEKSPFSINTCLQPWPKLNDKTRRAGISSFGQGGTNVHVIVEEFKTPDIQSTQAPSDFLDTGFRQYNDHRERNNTLKASQFELLTVSARTRKALNSMTQRLSEFMQNQLPELANVAFTLQTGRRQFNERCAVLVQNNEEAIRFLSKDVTQISGKYHKQIITGTVPLRPPEVIFLFAGQDSAHSDMARSLYDTELVFRSEVDRCIDILRRNHFPDLPSDWYPSALDKQSLIPDRTADPVPLFIVEYALARMWQSLGVRPQAMLGYSLGEYTAACISGVLSLEDALHVAVSGAKLLPVLKPGLMLAVPMSSNDIFSMLGLTSTLISQLDIAMTSTPNQCVVGGTDAAVTELERLLSQKEIGYTRLPLSYAFHTRLMEPFLEPFRAELKKVRFNPPTIPYVSCVTGQWIQAEEAMDPEHYVKLSRQTVRLAEGFSQLLKTHSQAIWLEAGAGQTLTSLAMQQPGRPSGHMVLSTLSDPRYVPKSDCAAMLTAIARLWVSGIDINWSARYSTLNDVQIPKRQRIPLPTYPFEHQRYWIDPVGNQAVMDVKKDEKQDSDLQAATKLSDPADWFYLPVWRDQPLIGTSMQVTGRWLVIGDNVGIADALVKAGAEIVSPTHTDWPKLFDELASKNTFPNHIVYLGLLGNNQGNKTIENDEIENWLNAGFFSIVELAQALSKRAFTDNLTLTVVASGVLSVLGNEVLQPAKAAVIGAMKVIPQEYSNITCRIIDVDVPELAWQEKSVHWKYHQWIESILKELALFKDASKLVALRGRRRLIEHFEPYNLEKPKENAVKFSRSGAYLITGGLGNIGMTFAKTLSEMSPDATIILTGRRPFEESGQERIDRFNQLKSKGVNLKYACADVADIQQMTALIKDIDLFSGLLKGVIHAAGLVGEQSFSSVSETTQAFCMSQFIPKLIGASVLEKVLGDRPLDFCMLCSSLSSILGGVGFTAYAAANTCLDAFVYAHNQRHPTHWLSVNWEGWRFDESTPPIAQLGASVIELGLTANEGVEAFQRMLPFYGGTLPRIVISCGHLDLRIRQWVNMDKNEPAVLIKRHNRPALLGNFVAPSGEIQIKLAQLWENLLGMNGIGAHDSFFELGGNSLLLTQLVMQIRKAFKLELALAELFDKPRIADIAIQISEGQAARDGEDREDGII